jgi:hypothetical protein
MRLRLATSVIACGVLPALGIPGAAAPDAAELRVTVGAPIVVPTAAPFEGDSLLRLPDGSLLFPGGAGSLRSTDGGRSWSRLPGLPGQVAALRDGSFYVLDPQTRPGPKPGRLVLRSLRVRNLRELAALRAPRWQEVPLEFEGWAPMTADNATQEVATPRIYDAVLELADGTLVAASYGNFVDDRVPMEGFVPTRGERWFKYRTYLLASQDRGQTWSFLSTVAYDGKSGQESFCEPAVVELGRGELVAVMRTGRFAPMYQARSLDGGRTWGRPESLHVLGLYPQLALLDNGILVCSFGWRPTKNQIVGGGSPAELSLQDYFRRYRDEVGLGDPSGDAGDYVMFSRDRGRSWTKPRQIAQPLTRGYTALAPAGPDACLVISRRVVIPGESAASVARKWAEDWPRWSGRSKIVFEARRITVAR